MARKEVFWFHIWCVLMPTGAQYYCNVTDPCLQANSSRIFEPYARYKNCQYDPKYELCDRYIIPQWYRVDEMMLTECPELLSCGTLYPVWLKGSLPLISDGIVRRKACKVGFNDCCREEVDIKIKNCGPFFAYCLGAMGACPERYCFGINGSCEVQESSTTSKKPTHPLTTITPPVISHTPPSADLCSLDPCKHWYIPDLTDPEERSMNCGYNQNSPLCDKFLTPGWFKSSTLMLNKCPGLLSCGTMFPVWMNGSHPTYSDGVVKRKACKRGFNSCCIKTYDIKVKNCGRYTAYCLTMLESCPERYCFGENEPCKIKNSNEKGANAKDSSAWNSRIIEISVGALLAIASTILGIIIGSSFKAFRRRQKIQSVVDLNSQDSHYDEIETISTPPPLYDTLVYSRNN